MKTLRIKDGDNYIIYNIYNIKSIFFFFFILNIVVTEYAEEYNIEKFNKNIEDKNKIINLLKSKIIDLLESHLDYAFIEINCDNGTINYCLN